MEEGTKKGPKQLMGDGYEYYLNCGNGFRDVYICHNVSNCTL